MGKLSVDYAKTQTRRLGDTTRGEGGGGEGVHGRNNKSELTVKKSVGVGGGLTTQATQDIGHQGLGSWVMDVSPRVPCRSYAWAPNGGGM